VDGTLGGGGHARQLAARVAPSGLVIGLDRDPAAIEAAERACSGWPVRAVHANYRDLPQVLAGFQITTVDAVLLDLGLSSDQLSATDRGFSFDGDGPLDLRFDPDDGEPAWRLIERLRQEELANLIFRYSDEHFSRRIARKIVESRGTRPIRTARHLADLVRRCVPRARGHRIDPATRIFQALRIAVNDELGALEAALVAVPDCLTPGGRFAVISFHSLEDRRVKTAFRSDPRLQPLTKKPVRPSEAEVARNPRSRSARLRAAVRVPAAETPS
jgi:16S rRNA (cytosine1402-N4)-methyltransferase